MSLVLIFVISRSLSDIWVKIYLDTRKGEREGQMKKAIFATIAVAGIWGTAEAAPLCHFDLAAKAWRNCRVLGVPSVKDPEQYLAIKAPQQNARPAEKCVLIKHAPGVDRWRCPPGTAKRLREAME